LKIRAIQLPDLHFSQICSICEQEEVLGSLVDILRESSGDGRRK
jgi:hypothetical protein